MAAHCGPHYCRLICGSACYSYDHKQRLMTAKHRIFTTSFASVYPHYVAKAEKKGRKKAEVDAVICWLTGYSPKELKEQLKKQTDFETFFAGRSEDESGAKFDQRRCLRRASGGD